MSSAALRIDRLQAWTERREERVRREWRQRVIASVIGHILVASVLIWAPSPAPLPLPSVVTIDLLAAAPRVAPAPAQAARKPAPPAPAPREPAPAPTPEPVVVPPPVQTKKLLPTEPQKVSKKPVPKPVPRPAQKTAAEPALDYEDALSSLRSGAGEVAPEPDAEEVVDAAPAAGGAGRLDPELARWQDAVDRRIKQTWVVPAEFRDTGLRTLLTATIMEDGTVLGTPRVKRSSGNPSYDDNAVRAIIQASPLPRPPGSGERNIWFGK